MPADFPAPQDIIPHQGPAVLLDSIARHTSDETTCITTVSDAMQYVQSGRADAALALELMAQTVGVHVGLEGKWSGKEPRAGDVIGVPKMTFSGGDYSVGDQLSISVKVVFHEGPVGRFEGRVVCGTTTRAQGALTVFEPPLAREAGQGDEGDHDEGR